MKEYKLKQWYPSLPSDWKDNMIIVVERTHNCQLHPSLDRTKITAKGIPHNEVNQPEFWEEIKPVKKDYEILSLISDEGKVSSRTKNGKVLWEEDSDPEWWSIEELLGKGEHFIHSVKRLSDGEVFTIGDKVINAIGRVMKIDKLYINKKGEACLKTDWTSSFTVNGMKKAPEPILKTEDGVDVYEGDTVYMIGVDWNIKSLDTTGYGKGDIPAICFSSEKAAEEYVIREKAVLNMNEIHELVKPFIGFHAIDFYSAIKSEIRKKLGL